MYGSLKGCTLRRHLSDVPTGCNFLQVNVHAGLQANTADTGCDIQSAHLAERRLRHHPSDDIVDIVPSTMAKLLSEGWQRFAGCAHTFGRD